MNFWRERRMEAVALGALAVAVVAFIAGWMTRDDPAEKPYLEIVGGGFIFNYRVADVFYGFTAQVMKPVPVGSIIVAEFEDPAGGPPLVVEKRVNARTARYGLRSPTVHGVQADQPYKVSVRLYDWQRKELLWQGEHAYSSRISDAIVPDKPLTIGPGYHRNPELPQG